MIKQIIDCFTLRFGSRESRADLWVSKRETGLTESEELRLSSWLKQDKRNEEAYFESEIVWQQMALIEDGNIQSSNVVNSPRGRKNWYQSGGGLIATGLAAVLLLSVILINSLTNPSESKHFSLTASGYEKHLLEDGSIVELNQGAEIEVTYTAQQRQINLKKGEAFFHVQGQQSWPFIVISDMGNVIATGTEFSVKRSQQLLEVWVLEGTVLYSPPNEEDTKAEPTEVKELTAGQMAIRDVTSDSPKTKIVEVSKEEIEIQLAWIDQIINFDSTPLYEIVAEFNRHNDAKIVIVDDELKTQKLTVAIKRQNYMDFIQLLELSLDVDVEYLGSVVLISNKTSNGTLDEN